MILKHIIKRTRDNEPGQEESLLSYTVFKELSFRRDSYGAKGLKLNGYLGFRKAKKNSKPFCPVSTKSLL